MSSPDPTQFTRGSAERIARVVRAAELATPGASPLNFERVDVVQKAKVFRVATFTGSWSKNTLKTVTFRGVTTTPNTAVATNLFAAISGSGTRNCAIAKDGTAWYLIAAEC